MTDEHFGERPVGEPPVGGEQGGRGDDFLKFQAALNRRFGDAIVSSWMSDLQLERMTDDSVTLSTESQLRCDTLDQRFIPLMKDAWCEEVRPIRRMSIVIRARLSAASARLGALTQNAGTAPMNGGASTGALRDGAPLPNGAAFPAKGGKAAFNFAGLQAKRQSEERAYALDELLSPLDERSTFERFAVDESNRMAYAAARHVFVKDAPAEVIYVHGPSGIGKTHLLHAVGNEWKRLYGRESCAYLAYHNITAGCSDLAFKNGGLHALHKDLLAKGVVLIDDIHLLGGAPRSQTEILNLINASLASGKRLVIAGELAPAKLAEAKIMDRLADRLSGGLAVAMAPGGASLRAEVLRKRLDAASVKCVVTAEAIDYVAREFQQSMRETLGALNQLLLLYGETPATVGLDEARAALRARLTERRRIPTLDEALSETAKVFGVTVEELKGRGQPQRLARARHGFVWVAREHLKESFPRIARTLQRDHTTAMSGYHRAGALIERDKKFQAAVKAIREGLGLPEE
ncbi:MAG: DnaA/Hda family protein [Amphiplicatus sp.]